MFMFQSLLDCWRFQAKRPFYFLGANTTTVSPWVSTPSAGWCEQHFCGAAGNLAVGTSQKPQSSRGEFRGRFPSFSVAVLFGLSIKIHLEILGKNTRKSKENFKNMQTKQKQ